MPNNKKGFTLIELLVVMGILGILMAVTILVINPAEYLKRSRDTQRINDLQTINSALGIYMANEGALGTQAYCSATSQGAATTRVGTTCNLTAATSTNTATTTGGVLVYRTTAGSGWVNGVNFSTMTGGAPFASLPTDPSNTTTYYYLWTKSASEYELNATAMESNYYTVTNNVAATDGGNSAGSYEVGTNLTLIVSTS